MHNTWRVDKVKSQRLQFTIPEQEQELEASKVAAEP